MHSSSPHFPEPQLAEGTQPDGDAQRILSAAADLLLQTECLLQSVEPSSYTTCVPIAFNGTIGGHVRHCLDHFVCLLRGFDSGLIDYDHRDRDERIERDPALARTLVMALRADLEQLDADLLDAAVQTRCEVSYRRGDSPCSTSSLGRELAYAVAHGIHHFALISILARLQGIQLPDGFGIAPSTLVHRRTQNAVAATR
jgi:uncharacterized damage-inducible protein DinB